MTQQQHTQASTTLTEENSVVAWCGERVLDGEAFAHLGTCSTCSAEVRSMRELGPVGYSEEISALGYTGDG